MLGIGDHAKDFALLDQDGELVRFADLRGKWLVLWWFPLASSETCSIEGRGFTKLAGDFVELGAEVLGLSFDSTANNAAFAACEGFGFRLLSDVSTKVGQSYGAKRGAGEAFGSQPRRITYLVDPEGVIRRSYHVTSVEDHAQRVLADLRSEMEADEANLH
jgi:peroxiredoxin Q/BCP